MDLFCGFQQDTHSALCMSPGQTYDVGQDGFPKNVRCNMHSAEAGQNVLAADVTKGFTGDRAGGFEHKDVVSGRVLMPAIDYASDATILSPAAPRNMNDGSPLPEPEDSTHPTLREAVEQAMKDAGPGGRVVIEVPEDDAYTQAKLNAIQDRLVSRGLETERAERPNIADEASKIVREREARYGTIHTSFDAITDLAKFITPRDATAEEAVAWTLIAMKLIRNTNSPDNQDHLRDAVGYLVIVDKLRRPE